MKPTKKDLRAIIKIIKGIKIPVGTLFYMNGQWHKVAK